LQLATVSRSRLAIYGGRALKVPVLSGSKASTGRDGKAALSSTTSQHVGIASELLGIIYDIWGAGTRPPSEEDPDHRIQVPLLAINSEAFTYWPVNFEKVDALVKEAQAGPVKAPAWLMTVRGTVHISQSDFVLLYPNLCSLFLKAVASPRRALDININASLEFLKQVLPADLTGGFRSFDNEGILQSDLSPLEQIPSTQLHRPDDKWVAARLKIRHEWAYRISPKLFRRLKRAKAQREGKADDTGNEVWLHSRPDEELVEEHRGRMEREAGYTASAADMPADPKPESEKGEASDGSTLHTDG
jgi:platelet-activating factor acetylhydrolase